MPSEPDANPLADWIESLEKLMSLPADTLVLPAHNSPFTGLHERLQFLLAHHQQQLDAVELACSEEKTAFELLPVLFEPRKIS